MNAEYISYLAIACAVVNFCVFKGGYNLGASHAYAAAAGMLRASNIPHFSISPDGKSITCHVCGATSWNANDVREKYCGRCHVYHDDRKALQET